MTAWSQTLESQRAQASCTARPESSCEHKQATKHILKQGRDREMTAGAHWEEWETWVWAEWSVCDKVRQHTRSLEQHANTLRAGNVWLRRSHEWWWREFSSARVYQTILHHRCRERRMKWKKPNLLKLHILTSSERLKLLSHTPVQTPACTIAHVSAA